MRHFRLLAATILLSTVAAFTPANAQEAKRTERVNLFVGTANDFGQMTPGACMPYSQIQVCPDSKPRQHPGYDYEVTTISGFSINRLSGVGGGGCGGNVSLMPDDTGEDVRLVKATEEASPGHYAVQLSNGVWVTATANRRMAVERFSFPENRTPVLLLNPVSAFDAVHEARFDQLTPTIGQGVGLVLSAKGLTCYEASLHAHHVTGSPIETLVPFASTSMRAVAGLIGFSLWAKMTGRLGEVTNILHDRKGLLCALAATITGPFIGVSLSLMATLYTSTGIAQTIMATTPLLILLPSYFFFHQRIGLREIIGAFISVVGVTLFFL